jgi:hypothetical protein
MHVAHGWPYQGRRVRQGPVVYCALEGAEGFRARIEAFRQRKMAEDATEVPFYLVASPLALVADYSALMAAIKKHSFARLRVGKPDQDSRFRSSHQH